MTRVWPCRNRSWPSAAPTQRPVGYRPRAATFALSRRSTTAAGARFFRFPIRSSSRPIVPLRVSSTTLFDQSLARPEDRLMLRPWHDRRLLVLVRGTRQARLRTRAPGGVDGPGGCNRETEIFEISELPFGQQIVNEQPERLARSWEVLRAVAFFGIDSFGSCPIGPRNKVPDALHWPIRILSAWN